MTRFELVIVKPEKDKPGSLLCTLFKQADTVSEAIREVKKETGALVLQAISYRQSVREYQERMLKELTEQAQEVIAA